MIVCYVCHNTMYSIHVHTFIATMKYTIDPCVCVGGCILFSFMDITTTHPSHCINMMQNDNVVHDVIGRCVTNNHVQYRIVFEHSIGQHLWENKSIVLTITDTVLLSEVSALDSLAGLQAKIIWREANASYDSYKLFFQNNYNSARNQRARHCWDGTFKRG